MRNSLHVIFAVFFASLRVCPGHADMAEFDQRALMEAQMAGEWHGTFRRYNTAGTLTAELPSHIIVRFPKDETDNDYHQTNILTLPGGDVQRIDSYGVWDGDVLRFSNTRLEGTYHLLSQDPTARSSVLLMRFTDGSNLEIAEIITVSEDGRSRHRAAQFLKNGQLFRRTLVDEERQDTNAQ